MQALCLVQRPLPRNTFLLLEEILRHFRHSMCCSPRAPNLTLVRVESEWSGFNKGREPQDPQEARGPTFCLRLGPLRGPLG